MARSLGEQRARIALLQAQRLLYDLITRILFGQLQTDRSHHEKRSIRLNALPPVPDGQFRQNNSLINNEQLTPICFPCHTPTDIMRY